MVVYADIYNNYTYWCTTGTAIAATIRAELKENVLQLQSTYGITPGLAVILVGDRRDSATYVRSKKKACAEIGINSLGFEYPATATTEEIFAKIDELNAGKYREGEVVNEVV